MQEFLKLVDNPNFLKCYFVVSFVISFLSGIAWCWRTSGSKAERFHNVIWNMTIHFFGFCLLFIQVYLLVGIFTSNDRSVQIVLGIIYFPVFFYTLFCISGRGIEILQKISERGIKEITIGLNGIKLSLGNAADEKEKSLVKQENDQKLMEG